MPEETKETTTEELTPEEEKKFSNFLGKFLKESDSPKTLATAPAPAATASAATAEPIQGGSSLKELIKNALDEREASKAKDSKLDQLTKEVEDLKKGKQKKGWSPFSPFNY